MSDKPVFKENDIIRINPWLHEDPQKIFSDKVFVIRTHRFMGPFFYIENNDGEYRKLSVNEIPTSWFNVEIIGNLSFLKEGVKIKLSPTNENRVIEKKFSGEFVIVDIDGVFCIKNTVGQFFILNDLLNHYYPVEVKAEIVSQQDTIALTGKVYNLIPVDDNNTIVIQGKKYFLVEKEG